jgi:hydroxymethylpyrimidine/phosphomethylpyrimidine kinase
MEIFTKERIGNLVPEVQTNIGLGLSNAKKHEDVLAIPGRVIKNGEDIFTGARPQFGGSRHVANIVLTVMQHEPDKRAVMNIKYTDALLGICKKLKFKIASFDRSKEPKKVRVREGSSLEWGTEKAITSFGSVPDIIYDLGGIRKEEMIRVIAEDMESLVKKILDIHRLYKKEG